MILSSVMHHSDGFGRVRNAKHITIFRMMEQCLRRAGVSPDDDKVSLGCPRPHADTGDMVSIRFLTNPQLVCLVACWVAVSFLQLAISSRRDIGCRDVNGHAECSSPAALIHG